MSERPAGAGGRAGRTVTVREAVRGAAALLAEAGVPSPEVDARLLAEHVLGRALYLLPAGATFDRADGGPDLQARFADLVERRRRREPLQHLTGAMAFRHLTLAAGPGAFVVRPETEVVAEAAIDALRRAGSAVPVAVDLCTGSGAIALAVATEVPGALVHAVELSPAAVAVARRNVAALAPSVHLVEGDAATALPELDGSVDVVVANPPYIPPGAVPREVEVREHDPDLALYGGGADGLDTPRAVVARAARLLRPGGVLVMEHAEVQAAAVRDLVTGAGFVDVVTGTDLTGRDRYVTARRAG
ncbi:peptide chain release factor N(5)-glutamine methyltransferase [Georgenia muralis]|uniref:Release factor glutamine methyltransferase n=1 Tax=Georgenia muralis TaxID=154117 RepID=A0A3N4YZS5_9MICO|nr:peptide chain release factor N(5)-glutamine methyltransferase [Georgenia muralis]RPF25797.1 release factor glutamine methyltransferase [Georgenia muralis]